jgi:hypothetical protein
MTPGESGVSDMGFRLAYTSGAMVVVTREGGHRRVPAGECRIGPHSTPRRCCTVRWREKGIEQSAEVSAEDLSAYVLGCVVQYA